MVSYSQDGSDTSSVGAPDWLSETPVMHSFTIPWSVSHEQHNRTGNQITTSIQPNLNKSYNNGHMAKSYNKAHCNKQQIKTATSSGPSQALTTQATDWENVLVRIVVIVAFFTIELLLIVWPS
jgi:hypothetical protein